MWLYILRRILQAFPMLLGVIVVVFFLIHLAPGDPVHIFLGSMSASEEYIAAVRERLGLDKPLIVQLLIYIKNILRGDLGYSYVNHETVFNLIVERIPATLLLLGTALIFSSIAGVILGVISSRRPYSITDNTNTLVALIGYSIPVFWFGMIMLMFFSLRLGLFPAQGMSSLRVTHSGIKYYLDVTHHLVLPTLALGFRYLAVNSRYARASMLEILGLEYITTARSKGLSERTIFFKHALRNALLPVVTLFGVNIGVIFAGAVLTETVFAWPGLGMLMLDAVYARDYPILMGLLLVISAMVIISNLITDIVYSFLDPRITYH